jgi:hypothetical protein
VIDEQLKSVLLSPSDSSNQERTKAPWENLLCKTIESAVDKLPEGDSPFYMSKDQSYTLA